nr:hypothetical protein [Clostridioides sp.]
MIGSLALILVLLIIFCLIAEFVRLNLITKGVRDAVKTATTAVMTQNYDETYPCLREGYGAGYKLNEKSNEWEEKIDKGNIEEQLINLLGVKKEGDYLVKKNGSRTEYKISNIKQEIINRDITPKDVNKAEKFKIEVSSKLEVPIAFGFEGVKPLNVNLKVTSGYSPIF